MFYSRSNAVQKAGSGAIIMLAIISLMIPIFWIVEGTNQQNATLEQHTLAVQRGMGLYAQYCIDNCYTIVNNKVVNPTYNGYTIAEMNAMTDDDLTRIIDSGSYNPAVAQPANKNDIVYSQDFNGPLSANDVGYLFQFLRSADPEYLQKNGFPSGASANAFNQLPDFLQNGGTDEAGQPLSGNANAYATAVALGKVGQFGAPVDMTKQSTLTLDIVNTAAGRLCNPSCFTPINIKVKVGTKITWLNQSSVGHTVTALYGDGSSTSKIASQIFDSSKGGSSLVATNATFTTTVTQAFYTFNTNHTVVYFCKIHPTMLAEITVVQ
jgi:plastocyanin